MATVPRFPARSGSEPAHDFFAITPHASTNFDYLASIYVGVAGDVVAINEGDTAVTFKNALAGSILPIKAKRVNATGTTATNLVGLY